MEHRFSLHGPTRSMSSLASTILPVLPCDAAGRNSPSEGPPSSQPSADLPLELTLPLPLSRPSSAEGDRDEKPDKSENCVAPSLPENTEDGLTKEYIPTAGRSECHQSPAEVQVEGSSLPVPLRQLISLHALERQHALQADQLWQRLKHLRISCGLSRRLLRVHSANYRAMAVHFNTVDQARFLETYDAGQRVLDVISSGLGPAADAQTGKHSGFLDPASEHPNWMEILPSRQRRTILDFLDRIRSDTAYIAECLLSLSSAELILLTSNYQSAKVSDSVLPGVFNAKAHRLGKNATPNPRTFWTHNSGQDDAIFLLLHCVFDDSLGPNTWEYSQRTEVWATACAKVLVSGRRGSDEILTTTLDAFANFQDWTLQPRLELYIAKVLRDGAFLLEASADRAVDFEDSVETRNAQAAVSTSNFFETSVQGLLHLLAENLPRAVPVGLQNLVRSILGKIEDPKIRNRAEVFIISKWFFCSFISSMVLYPENHGMLMSHHIGNTARTAILKELVLRLQKQVFDVSSPWKHSLVSPLCQALIEQIFDVFKPIQEDILKIEHGFRIPLGEGQQDTATLLLSPQDVLTLIKTLRPQPLSSPDADESPHSENVSKASSLAESSTLTSGSTGYGSGILSSAAPSLSGTSMTSTTILSEALTQDTFSYLPEHHSDGQAIIAQGSQDAHGVQKQAGNEFAVGLPEACRTLSGIANKNLDSRMISDPCNWALFSSSTRVRGRSLGLTDGRKSFRPVNVDAGSGREYGMVSSYELHYLEDAISKSLDIYDSPPGLQHGVIPLEHIMDSKIDSQSTLDLIFRSAMASSGLALQFHEAHFWWTAQQALHEIRSRDSSGVILSTLFADMIERKQSAINTSIQLMSEYESHVRLLESSKKRQKMAQETADNRCKALRMKMWYVCDVKHSATYEDALAITRALKAMTDSKRSKKSSGVTSWARQRLRAPLSQDKSMAQVLEALAAPKDFGGLTKLADQQVELTTRWLTRNSVENFCKGEERIHRYCQEIQRCVNRLAGANMLESPVLWSSSLFMYEKHKFERTSGVSTSQSLGEGYKVARHTPWSNGLGQAPPSPVSPLIPPPPMYGLNWSDSKSTSVVRDTHKPYINTSEAKGRHGIWSSLATADSAPWFPSRFHSASLGVPTLSTSQVLDQAGISSIAHDEARISFVSNVKEAVTSLLLSDLGYLLWHHGTETDIWLSVDNPDRGSGAPSSIPAFRPPSGSRLPESSPARGDALSDTTITANSYQDAEHTSTSNGEEVVHNASEGSPQVSDLDGHNSPAPPFPFSSSFATILEKLSCTQDPYTKLDLLYELELLIASSLDDLQRIQVRAQTTSAALNKSSPLVNNISARGITVPRTKATSLEEVIANCTERRAGTLQHTAAHSPTRSTPLWHTMFQPPNREPTGTDEIVEGLLSIFRNDALRPPTLYRDLQLIAAHIPSSVLDRTLKGKAFWDAGLAALALKEERVAAIIARATRITTYHISATKDDTQSFTDAYAPDLVNTTLADAAHLWTIAAKEGNPVAARELALFYLTHPELVPRVTLPLSKAKDVFRNVGTGANEKGVDTGGLDPRTFAVVFHWMEVAASGGDKDARDFLRGTGDLSGGR